MMVIFIVVFLLVLPLTTLLCAKFFEGKSENNNKGRDDVEMGLANSSRELKQPGRVQKVDLKREEETQRLSEPGTEEIFKKKEGRKRKLPICYRKTYSTPAEAMAAAGIPHDAIKHAALSNSTKGSSEKKSPQPQLQSTDSHDAQSV